MCVTYVHLCMSMGVCIHVETWCLTLLLFIVLLVLFLFFEKGSLTEPRPDQQALSPPPQYWDYRHMCPASALSCLS